jgi:hypothetical protein
MQVSDKNKQDKYQPMRITCYLLSNLNRNTNLLKQNEQKCRCHEVLGSVNFESANTRRRNIPDGGATKKINSRALFCPNAVASLVALFFSDFFQLQVVRDFWSSMFPN